MTLLLVPELELVNFLLTALGGYLVDLLKKNENGLKAIGLRCFLCHAL
jgi:hypothetical protein